jgi:hypothetical protein
LARLALSRVTRGEHQHVALRNPGVSSRRVATQAETRQKTKNPQSQWQCGFQRLVWRRRSPPASNSATPR